MKRVYFDLETTGLSAKTSKIIQIGAVCGDRSFQVLVNPEETLPPKIVELTGISQDMVDKCDTSIRQALGEFISFISDIGGPVQLVAYNGHGFDNKFLYHSLNATHLTMQFEAVCQGFGDPLMVLRKQVHSSDPNMSHWRRNKTGNVCLKLGSVYSSIMGCEFANAHTALADCKALQTVVDKLSMQLPQISIEAWKISCTIDTKKRKRKPLPLVEVSKKMQKIIK